MGDSTNKDSVQGKTRTAPPGMAFAPALQGEPGSWIGRYEEELLRFLEKEYGKLQENVAKAILYASLFVHAGHVCLPLKKSEREWRVLLDLDYGPEAERTGAISHSPRELLDHPAVGLPEEETPFVVDGEFLFIRRQYTQQLYVHQEINRMSSEIMEDYDPARAKQLLQELFPGTDPPSADWQKTAAVLSLRNRLLILSGGPGTGKTTTVSRILRLLEGSVRRPLRTVLAAPTGKAAARMNGEAITLHRFMGRVREWEMLPPVEKKLLHYDIIVVEEAFMIDLSLMECLLRHLGK